MTTTSLMLHDKITDTFFPVEVNAEELLPVPDIQQQVPASYTQQISIENDTPRIQFLERQTRLYYLPDISWEGMVIDVLDDSFVARLVDINNPSQQEEAEILFTSISDQDDLKLIKPGSIFFWSIGRHVKGRRSEQFSLIQFRRLPVWTKKEKELAVQEAAVLKNELGW